MRGFPTPYFPYICRFERYHILGACFGGLSPHPKIPFPAAGLGHEIRLHLKPQFRVCAAVIQVSPHGRAPVVDLSSLFRRPKNRGPFHLVPVIAKATLERLS